MSKIDEQLLQIMQCPVGKAPLVQVGEWLYSTDANTRRKYPIRDGIPIMLAEESVVVGLEEFEQAMAGAKHS
ncbi:MAG: Trm112 family protein [Planctomycetota bacterium]